MYNEGDIVPSGQLVDPTTGRLSQIFRKVRNFMLKPIATSQGQDVFVVMSVLKDKAAHVVNLLSQTHWTSSCIITITRFQQICGGTPDEASAILSFLSAQGKARHLSLNKIKGDMIQVPHHMLCFFMLRNKGV